MKQLTIYRCHEVNTPMEQWKDLISSLVLNGYKVYGDQDSVSFTLGHDDILKDIEE